MFISEKNKKTLLKKIITFLGITAFIALFGIVYEQFSHNVDTPYMWFAWAWVLGFGVVPYVLLYFVPVERVPGLLPESVYICGVGFITFRSIYIGVIQIYGTTNDLMVRIYTRLSIFFLAAGFLLYVIGMITFRIKKKKEQ